MKDQELLKQNIVDKRLVLAGLMYNASQDMTEEGIDAMQADLQRIHLFANNGDLQGALDQTEKMIQELKHQINKDK